VDGLVLGKLLYRLGMCDGCVCECIDRSAQGFTDLLRPETSPVISRQEENGALARLWVPGAHALG